MDLRGSFGKAAPSFQKKSCLSVEQDKAQYLPILGFFRRKAKTKRRCSQVWTNLLNTKEVKPDIMSIAVI